MSKSAAWNTLEAATQRPRVGAPGEWAALRRAVLTDLADQADAIKLLGIVAHRWGHPAESIELLRKSLSLKPDQAECRSVLGGVLAIQGQADVAIDELNRAIALDPAHAPAYFNLGNVLASRGKFDQAADAYSQAFRIDSTYFDAAYNLGCALRAGSRGIDALDAFREVVRIQPQHLHAWNDIGVLLLDLNRVEESVDAFERALPCGLPEPHNNLGNALQRLGRYADAVEAYRGAIRLRPNYGDAYCNLSNAYRQLGRLSESIATANRAVALNPKLPHAHLFCALAAMELREFDRAALSLRTVIKLNPNFASAHHTLGRVLQKQGDLDGAIELFRRAIALDGSLGTAHAHLGNALRERGEIEAAVESYRTGAMLSDEPWVGSCLIYGLHFHPGTSGAEICRQAKLWNDRFAGRIAATPDSDFITSRDNNRRLKIGYVSPDFRAHAIGLFLLRLLANHDQDAVEIYCYSGVRNPDAITERFKTYADVWRPTAYVSDEQLATQIRDDRIDVLVDLTMHLDDGRLLTFARRPAPIQVTYLAHPGTTGLAAFDYRLADRFIDPAESESHFTEQTCQLSGSYFCYDPMDVDLPVNAPPVLENGFITFGCFNSFAKINDTVLKLWARLLTALPESRLNLLAPRGFSRSRVQNLLGRHGVDPQRIAFVDQAPRPVYMKHYHGVDVALDPFPYTGHTTTLDALWMGVPVVTLPGETTVSRGALSILSHLEMPELIAQSPDHYVQIARDLALDTARIVKLRSTLRDRLEQSPLMDGAAFAKSFEDAYRRMWNTRLSP